MGHSGVRLNFHKSKVMWSLEVIDWLQAILPQLPSLLSDLPPKCAKISTGKIPAHHHNSHNSHNSQYFSDHLPSLQGSPGLSPRAGLGSEVFIPVKQGAESSCRKDFNRSGKPWAPLTHPKRDVNNFVFKECR